MSELIFGRHVVLEALEEADRVQKVYILKDAKGSLMKVMGRAKAEGIPVIKVDRKKLDELAAGGLHQGVVALAGEFRYTELEDILAIGEKKGRHVLILLDGIVDPHNLGAILRSAEVSGADGVIIPKRRAALVNATAMKASAGAARRIPVARVTNLSDTIRTLKERNIWVYGAAGEASRSYAKTDLRGSVALVIGNEGRGLSPGVAKACDGLIHIPMKGQTGSLNASNAAVLLLYEVLRQHEGW